MFEYVPNIFFSCLLISVSCTLGYKNFEDVGKLNVTSLKSEEPVNTTFINATRKSRSRPHPFNIYSYNNQSARDDAINETEYYISEKYFYDYEKRIPLKSENNDRSVILSLHENRRPCQHFHTDNNFQRFSPPNNHRIHRTMPYENNGNHRYPTSRWDRDPLPPHDRHVPPPLPRYHHLPSPSYKHYPPTRYADTSVYKNREMHPSHYYDRLHHSPPFTFRRPPPPHQVRWSPPGYNRRGPPIYERNPSSRFSSSLPRDYADRAYEFEHHQATESSRRDIQSQQDVKNNQDQLKPQPQPQVKENPDEKLPSTFDLNNTRNTEHSPELVAKKYDDKITKMNSNKSNSNTEADHNIEENYFQSVKHERVTQQQAFYPLLPNFFQVVPVTPKR